MRRPKGFIYIVTNKLNNRKYIGRKWYFDNKNRSTNWRNYYGSSKELKSDIIKYGITNFLREIICVCFTAKDLADIETELIKEYNAVNSAEFYNKSENTAPNFITPERVLKIKETRSKWSKEKKEQVHQKLVYAYIHRPKETEQIRREKIGKSLKQNLNFSKIRSNTQKKVAANRSFKSKQEISRNQSDSAKHYWNNLTEKEKQQHTKLRYGSMTIQEQNNWKQRMLEGKKIKKYTLQNIQTKETFTGTTKELLTLTCVPGFIISRLYNQNYNKENIYKKTWKIIMDYSNLCG